MKRPIFFNRRIVAVILCALLILFVGAGCGQGKAEHIAGTAPSDTSKGSAASGEQETGQEEAIVITGEVFNAGNVSALVPDGWLAVAVNDMRAEDPNSVNPDQLNICKGAKTVWDLTSNPYVNIVHYGPKTDMIRPSAGFYKDAKELAPVTVGDRTWEGITGTSAGMPLAILWAGAAGESQFQVTLWLKNDSGEIHIDDADVQAIIASIQPSA